MKSCLHYLTLVALGSLLPAAALAQDSVAVAWPLEFVHEHITVVVYQPQLESFSGDHLEARAAVSVKQGDGQPVFGAVWIDARVSTDRDARTVDLVDLTVTDARLPEASEENLERLKAYLSREMPRVPMQLSLDQLLAELDRIESRRTRNEAFDNAPPDIVVVNTPTVLVSIDGEPIFARDSKSNLESVLNTAFVIVRDGSELYLRGGNHWYRADAIDGAWQVMADSPPQPVVGFARELSAPVEPDSGSTAAEPSSPPAVRVATTPTEIIQIDGEPELVPVDNTDLLYVKNTESDVIMEIASQSYFVLLAGRWYQAPSLAGGPWSFVAHDALPETFANIPAESDLGDVRVSVAGTVEAREAVLDQSIPQTATVSREEAKLNVGYDGEPKFESIPGTGMSYAINTDKSVLFIDTRYYCCDDAIWFVADKPTGPWSVCADVPREVQDIPPECPVYNVKYVTVYDYTPTIVYVGYYPGYTGAYVWGGCVVYGTGYYYRPWYHTVYYPRPVTYGFGVHYNPWTGWGFSVGVSYGWFNVRVSTGYGGYWGPAGYHHGYRHGYARGYHHGYQRGARAGYAAGYRAGHASNNVYRHRNSGVRSTGNAGRGSRPAQPAARPAAKPAQRPNNVYADKNGNVYRRDNNGQWQQRQNQNWSGNRGVGGTPPTQMDRSRQRDLERQHQSRQRGAQRSGRRR